METAPQYNVFIGSTFSEAHSWRQNAQLGILKAGHLPVALDIDIPESEQLQEALQTALSRCHYYVVFLGNRYGSSFGDQGFPPHEELGKKSWIEMELDFAIQANLKILVF